MVTKREVGKDAWAVVEEGFGDLRNGVDDKDTKSTARITDFLVFALRGFVRFEVELRTGAFGKELIEDPARKAKTMKEFMYRKGIRVPLANRIINGLEDAAWGPEVPGCAPGNSLLARDFAPWGLNSCEDYIGKNDKPEERSRPPSAMGVISRTIKQQKNAFGAVYGEAHISERLEALSPMGDLRESYEEFFAPAFLMSVWGCNDFRVFDGGGGRNKANVTCIAEG